MSVTDFPIELVDQVLEVGLEAEGLPVELVEQIIEVAVIEAAAVPPGGIETVSDDGGPVKSDQTDPANPRIDNSGLLVELEAFGNAVDLLQGEIGDVDAAEQVDAAAIVGINDTLATFGDIVTHDASEFDPAGAADDVAGDLADETTARQAHEAATGTAVHGLGTASTRNVPAAGNASAAEVVKGNDTRLTDARTPALHAASHKLGGTDALKLNEFAAPTGSVDFNNQRGLSVASATVDTDAANLGDVKAQIALLRDTAPGALDTLKEIDDAIGNDPNFATTLTTSIATKVPLSVATANNQVLIGTASGVVSVLDVTASTFVARGAAGNLTAMSVASAKTMLSIAAGDVSGLGALATLNAVGSAQITDGSIVNADLNANAAITLSRLEPIADQRLVGNVSGGAAVPTVLTAANVSTFLGLGSLATLSAVGSAQITDGSVANVDLADMAAKTVKMRHTNSIGPAEDVSMANLLADLSGQAGAAFSFNAQDIDAKAGTFSGAVSGTTGTFAGTISTTTGIINATDGTASHGKVQTSVTAFGAATNWIGNSGDTQPKVSISTLLNGMAFGPGGSTATDWTLARTGAAAAAITGALTVSTTLTSTGAFTASSTVALNGNVTVGSGINFILNTGTGTQWATAANQKQSFWGAAAIVQPSSTATTTAGFTAGAGTTTRADSTFTGNTGSTAYHISDIVRNLKDAGILAP